MTERSTSFKERGGFWLIGQGLLTVAVGVLGVAWPGRTHGPSRVAGIVLLGLSALLGALGLMAQGRRLTPFPKPPEKAQLLEHGVYAWMRHPLYTCNLCAFFGWALLWNSRPALSTAVIAVGFFFAKARREELWLCQRFERYPAYQKRVKRFIPWVW
jgi:protein-S-isoprenylcysteine O-methyltransferase Ste14